MSITPQPTRGAFVANQSSAATADATLIVVTHNSSDYFPRLNEAIKGLTYQPTEVIVVDSGSGEMHRPTSRTFPMATRIIQVEENIGFAAANNLAASLAKTEYLALLNPDAFPEPGWLEALVTSARAQPECAAFGSTQLSGSMCERFDGLGDEYHISGLAWRTGYGVPCETIAPQDRIVFSPCAAAALYRSAVWRELSGFEETFFCYCEDVDLGFRIRLLGWEIMQVASAVVTHIGGASSGVRSAFSVYHGTRNRIWVYFRNYPLVALIALLPVHVGANLAFLLASFIRGTSVPTMKGIADAVAGLPTIFKQRQRIQRRVSSWTVLRQMIWSPIPVLTRRPPRRSRLSTAFNSPARSNTRSS